MKHGLQIIDSDIHVIEPPTLWQEYLDPQWRDRAPEPVVERGPVLFRIDGKAIPPFTDEPERLRAWEVRREAARRKAGLEETPHPVSPGTSDGDRGTRPEAMLNAMQVEGIDIGIVFRTWASHVFAIDGMDPEFAAALCRAYNRWAADFCDTDRARLRLGAMVPMQDAEHAISEAEHAIRDLGAITLVLPSHMVNDRPIYDRIYDPLWALAEEAGVAVSFHGNHTTYTSGHLGGRYKDNMVLSHAAGQPVELMLQMGAALTGGILSRYPNLRMAFLEGNCGWLPWWLWALDERWESWADRDLFGQDELPSTLFRRQCFISIEPDEELGKHVVAELGDDNIVISTDWPHDDSRYPHAVDTFLAQEHLGQDTKRKVLWDNCARLYGIDRAP